MLSMSGNLKHGIFSIVALNVYIGKRTTKANKSKETKCDMNLWLFYLFLNYPDEIFALIFN